MTLTAGQQAVLARHPQAELVLHTPSAMPRVDAETPSAEALFERYATPAQRAARAAAPEASSQAPAPAESETVVAYVGGRRQTFLTQGGVIQAVSG